MREIKLTQGYVAIVDDEDFDRVNGYAWFFSVSKKASRNNKQIGYAKRNLFSGGKYTTEYLHRFIMNPGKGLHVDHINGDKLDCRRSNMRVCTQTENNRNTSAQRNSTSKYRGVCWDNGRKMWLAQIKTGGKNKYLGHFENEKDAAIAYNEYSRCVFGEFSSSNNINGGS